MTTTFAQTSKQSNCEQSTFSLHTSLYHQKYKPAHWEPHRRNPARTCGIPVTNGSPSPRNCASSRAVQRNLREHAAHQTLGYLDVPGEFPSSGEVLHAHRHVDEIPCSVNVCDIPSRGRRTCSMLPSVQLDCPRFPMQVNARQ